MRIPQTYVQKIKAGVHFAQAFLIFIGGCLALAVLTKDGETGGQIGFYFALCFLSLPGLIYQIMVPMWTRVYRFANVYAYAAIDLLYTLLWFAAFIAVAVWRSSGKRDASDKDNTSNDSGNQSQKNRGGTCANWKYGSASKCDVAQASVGFGVVIFLLFGITSAVSVYGIIQFRRTGIMPNGNSRTHGQAEQLDDGGKDAWSTNTDDLEPSRLSSANDDPRRAYGQLPMEEDSQSQTLLQRPSIQTDDPFADTHSMTEHGMHPGRALSYQSSTNLSITTPPSYHEQSSIGAGGTSPTGYVAPSALSPSDYAETPGGTVNFPRGNYDADFR